MNLKTKSLIYTLVTVASVTQVHAKIEISENEIHGRGHKILHKNPFAFFRKSAPVNDQKYYKGYHKSGWTLRIDSARRKSFPGFDAKQEAEKICALFYNNDFEAYGREIFLLSDKHYEVPGALPKKGDIGKRSKKASYLDPLIPLLVEVFREQSSAHNRPYKPIPSFENKLPLEEVALETSQQKTEANVLQDSLLSITVDNELAAFKEQDESVSYDTYSSSPQSLSQDQENELVPTFFQRPKSQFRSKVNCIFSWLPFYPL
ncbi:MAG TPA: hypothetical protein VMW10_02260 [Alphaproteobacteria bacterium]|nr:hypothetical protein [Alphaproteobacteria bacterium]